MYYALSLTFPVTSKPKPSNTVPRVFQSFLGQTFTINFVIIFQSLLRCSFAVTTSELSSSFAIDGRFAIAGEGVVCTFPGLGARSWNARRDIGIEAI
jgi:hypothetical protein